MSNTEDKPRFTLTAAQVARRNALETVCHYGSHSIVRRTCGLWGGYQALKREGLITLSPAGHGKWFVQLVGKLHDAYLAGEDMTPFARGER